MNYFKRKLLLFIFQKSASFVVNCCKPKIILVSGTLGKTSTKDAIFHVFESKYSVRKTADNANNEFGVAYTILGIDQSLKTSTKLAKTAKNLYASFFGIGHKYPEFLVIEVGSRAPGDIKKSIYYLSPDIAVITKIAKTPSHIEYFKDLNEQAKEEFSVIDCLKKDGRILCFEEDLKYLTKEKSLQAIGVSDLVDYKFSYDKDGKLEGCSYNIAGKNKITCKGFVSLSYGYAINFALMAYKFFGEIDSRVIDTVGSLKATKGRSKIIEGVNGSLIIDDSYNAGPDSVFLALDGLKKIDCSGRKIVVLGEMLELGNYSKQAHIDVLSRAKGVADEVHLLGQEFGEEVYKSPTEIGHLLYKKITKGDIVLIKGSQGNRLEVVTKLLSRFSKTVDNDLVRQTKFWKMKSSIIFPMDHVPFYDQNTQNAWQEKGLSSLEEGNFWNIRGCGIACVKMVAEAFGGEILSIGKLIKEAFDFDAYKKDVGWIHSKIALFISEKFNLKAETQRNVLVSDIRNVLVDGGLVIASIGFGFRGKKSGHLIVVMGCEIKDGEVAGFYVHHPSSKKEFRMTREYVPIQKFESSFSGSIIKVKNKI